MALEKRQLIKKESIGVSGVILARSTKTGELTRIRIPQADYDLFAVKKSLGGVLLLDYPLPDGYEHTGTALGGVPIYDTPSTFLEDNMYAELSRTRVAIKLAEHKFEGAFDAAEVDSESRVTIRT